MNQENIGKFILKCRNAQNLTQQELADKIGVTDKAISKWENGRGLPDYSLFEPLCNALNISVFELLKGEKLKGNSKEEKSIFEYIKYSKKKLKHKIILITILSLLLITFILSTVCFFFNSYNKIIVYELSGESETFLYEGGYLTESNMYNIYTIGNITPKNPNQKIEISKVYINAKRI